jgi:hypothetical protein
MEGKIMFSGKLRIGGEEFDKPNTNDVLGCNSGLFTTSQSPTRDAIIPRLAAASHRTALLNRYELCQKKMVNHISNFSEENSALLSLPAYVRNTTLRLILGGNTTHVNARPQSHRVRIYSATENDEQAIHQLNNVNC